MKHTRILQVGVALALCLVAATFSAFGQSCGSGGCNNPNCGCCGCDGNCLFDSSGGCCGVSPIVIDLTSKGFSLTNVQHGVEFRITPGGPLVQMSWTAPGSHNAWLVLDRNGDGQIESLSELFGNFTPQPNPPPAQQKNGFLALAVYDKPENGGNGDGWITAADAVFAKLRVWEDANHNGISEPRELRTLDEVGITGISLTYTVSAWVDQYGNRFRYRGTLLDAKGDRINNVIYDVFLMDSTHAGAPTSTPGGGH